MTENEYTPLQQSNTNDSGDARFIGWQETNTGHVFALYNITAELHPLRGSTVTEHGLREMKLNVPETPVPDKPIRIIGSDRAETDQPHWADQEHF